jgi:hypothetical protein
MKVTMSTDDMWEGIEEHGLLRDPRIDCCTRTFLSFLTVILCWLHRPALGAEPIGRRGTRGFRHPNQVFVKANHVIWPLDGSTGNGAE